MAESSIISYGRAIRERAIADPMSPAATCGSDTIHKGGFEATSIGIARAMVAAGVRPNDLVALSMPNSIGFVVACVACWKAGATPLPLSARLSARELRAMLDIARPSLVVHCEEQETVVTSATRGRVPVLQIDRVPPPAGSEIPDPLPDLIPSSWKANTSGGSTGRSKVIISDIPASIDGSSRPNAGLPVGATVLVPGPLHHSGPFHTAMQSILYGNHLILADRFDPHGFLGLIERHRVTWTVVVPTMMHRIWQLPAEERTAYDLSSLEVLLHSAAPCPPWLKHRWIEWLGPERVFETYGGTEGYGSTWIGGDEYLLHPGSVGRAAPDSEAIILRDDGSTAAVNEVGLLHLRPRDPGAPTFHYVADVSSMTDRWFSIGDLAWMDSDGYVYLTDRRTDLVISGGANVYPAEVEGAIAEHPAVDSCAVIGLPDDDLGQRVHAIVQCSVPVAEADLREFLAGRLSSYKIPRQFEFVDEPLRDEWGKVRRFQLREARTTATIPRRPQGEPVGQEP